MYFFYPSCEKRFHLIQFNHETHESSMKSQEAKILDILHTTHIYSAIYSVFIYALLHI